VFWESAPGHMVASVVYSLIGVVIFAIAFLLIEKIAPFSLRKELAEDDNVAVGVVLGSIVIGLSIIIASAIAT
jgi:putative membrane protein